ncbi:MAG TPA: hypothetical protein VLA17_10560 [Candidatus Limnocylindria bacterium]|nr:hypothetical protein [Candidatus Limnocylindria bacterium]
MKTLAATAFLGALICLASIEDGFSQAPFYAGKTITIVLGTDAGGTGDMRTRAVATVLRNHIPGRPTVIIEYMPGGGGRRAANHVYKVARPDGLTIGAMLAGFVPSALLDVGVLYDLDKVTYLGTSQSGVSHALFTRKAAGLNTLEKLRMTPGVRLVAPSVGHIVYTGGRVVAYVLGMNQPRFVTGFSGPEMDVAIERGEVDGRVQGPDALIERNPDWIQKGLLDFHTIIEVPKGKKFDHPLFRSVPDLETFAQSERERKVVNLYRAFRNAGPPYILPPGTPKEPAGILRAAMRKTFADPEFLKEFKKLSGEDAVPLMPEELEKVIRELPREPEIIDLFKKLAGAEPLPPR